MHIPQSPIRVEVHAAIPAVWAGLVSLLRGEGIQVLDAPSEPGEADVRVTVATADLPTGAAMLRIERAGMLTRLDAPPAGLLPLEVDARALAAAVIAVDAGLHVTHPALRLDAATTDEPSPPPAGRAATLTVREADVLRHLADGRTNRAIAGLLRISEHTAKSHVAAVLAKLDARSRTEAVTTAARRGWLTL